MLQGDEGTVVVDSCVLKTHKRYIYLETVVIITAAAAGGGGGNGRGN